MRNEKEILKEIEICEKEIKAFEKEYANFLIPENICDIWTNYYRDKINVLKWVLDK